MLFFSLIKKRQELERQAVSNVPVITFKNQHQHTTIYVSVHTLSFYLNTGFGFLMSVILPFMGRSSRQMIPVASFDLRAFQGNLT